MKWTPERKRANYATLRARGTSDNPRDRAGCICTLRDETTGRLVTLHRNGFREDALRAVAAWCDLTPGDWRVIGYSTPETTRGDLSGARLQDSRHGLEGAYVQVPEVEALGRIGRHDLVAPEHIAHSDWHERGRVS